MSLAQTTRRNPRPGAIAVYFALSMTAVMGILAVLVDGGMLLSERRHAQAVADAAALAGAVDLYQKWNTNAGVDPSPSYPAKTSAAKTAHDNGYLNSLCGDSPTNSTVTVNEYPKNYQGGPNVGTQIPKGYVEVIATYNEPRLFSRIWSTGTVPVSARAVARAEIGQPPFSILVLNSSSANGALTATGGAQITAPYPIEVDDAAHPTTGTPIVSSGGSKIISETKVAYQGTTTTPTGVYAPASGSTTNVSGGASNVSDPLSSSLTAGPTTVNGGTALTVQSTSQLKYNSGTHTIYQGIYQGGISVSSGAVVTMNPGIYYIEGGGLTVQNNNTVLKGNGVLIYNGETNGATTSPSSVGSINIAGSGELQITPMTSGAYEGISIYQDRLATAALTISGGSGTTVGGAVYAPAAAATVSGGSNINPGDLFITSTLTVSGGSFVLPPPTVPIPAVGSTTSGVSLVE